MTEYEYEYYSVSQKWPNTNMNIIRFHKNDRIRIRILFGVPKMTEYEYEYYSAFQKGPNTNTNIIQFSKNDRIRILFGFPKIHSGEKSNKCKQCEMQSCMHVSILIHKVRKIFKNEKNVILHFWPKKFEGAFWNAQTNSTIHRQFEDKFENAQWRKAKQMQELLHFLIGSISWI